jgi:hypothetical protein
VVLSPCRRQSHATVGGTVDVTELARIVEHEKITSRP